MILIAMRTARRWNQTGQKFAGEPDIGRTFLFEHRIFFWTILCITYLWNLSSLASNSFPRYPQLLSGGIATALATAAVTFKLAFTYEDSPELMVSGIESMASNTVGLSLVIRARIVFIAIGMTALYTIISGFSYPKKSNRPFSSFPPSILANEVKAIMRTLHDLLFLLLITQSRTTNIPLLLVFEIMHYALTHLHLSPIELSTTSVLLQHASFFAFGGSNAISSVDLSSAYNGVSGYNVLAVGILTFVSNWAGPIFWTSATNLLLLKMRNEGDKKVLGKHLGLLTVFVTASLVGVMVACTMLRTHLFIWTVFSPKYLFSMAWSLGQHLAINVGVGSLLFWLGTLYM